MYDFNFLIVGNPTYRTMARMVETIENIFSLGNGENKYIIKKSVFFSYLNANVKCSNANAERSAKRKLSEINKYGFFQYNYLNEDMVEITKTTSLYNLFPNIFHDDLIERKEFISNTLIWCLTKNNTLKLLYDLILDINKIWVNKYKRHRNGLLSHELVYLYFYLKKYNTNDKKMSLELLVDKIIRKRKESDSQKGTKKDFYEKEINKLITDEVGFPKIKSIQDYIDTLLRTLDSTSLFKIENYSKNNDSYINPMICINETFIDKLKFFINLELKEFKELINNNQLIKKLYSSFKCVKAYKQNQKLMENFVKNPDLFVNNVSKDFKDNMDWSEFEFKITATSLSAIKKNNFKRYPYFKKTVAIKLTNDGFPYKATTGGIADCNVVLSKIILNIEATKLVKNYTQCNKEFIPCKKHIEDAISIYPKKKGISLIVTNVIGVDLIKEIKNSNHSNKTMNNESILMFAFNVDNYLDFIKDLTETKLISFFDFIWSLDEKYYSDNYLVDVLTNFNLKYYGKCVK